jgi:hypothetical protein
MLTVRPVFVLAPAVAPTFFLLMTVGRFEEPRTYNTIARTISSDLSTVAVALTCHCKRTLLPTGNILSEIAAELRGRCQYFAHLASLSSTALRVSVNMFRLPRISSSMVTHRSDTRTIDRA